MTDTPETVRAYIYPGLTERIVAFFRENYFEADAQHASDPEFIALAERIDGQVVDLAFTAGDAFEAIDNNYWLPDCCWERREESPE